MHYKLTGLRGSKTWDIPCFSRSLTKNVVEMSLNYEAMQLDLPFSSFCPCKRKPKARLNDIGRAGTPVNDVRPFTG
ncbi:MAG TPA: hypothetical protein PKV73_14685 [Agriterribacter sp.]|nr:hypothetical protein [Agriterribacter sp.]